MLQTEKNNDVSVGMGCSFGILHQSWNHSVHLVVIEERLDVVQMDLTPVYSEAVHAITSKANIADISMEQVATKV